jgi:hypothetical protein
MGYWIKDPKRPWISKYRMGTEPTEEEKNKSKGPYILKGFSKFDPDSRVGEPTKWM